MDDDISQEMYYYDDIDDDYDEDENDMFLDDSFEVSSTADNLKIRTTKEEIYTKFIDCGNISCADNCAISKAATKPKSSLHQTLFDCSYSYTPENLPVNLRRKDNSTHSFDPCYFQLSTETQTAPLSLLTPLEKSLEGRRRQPKRMFSNYRERWRQKKVNMEFRALRRVVPTYPPDRKLSKHEVLRLAIKYIKLLNSVLDYQVINYIDNNSYVQTSCTI